MGFNSCGGGRGDGEKLLGPGDVFNVYTVGAEQAPDSTLTRFPTPGYKSVAVTEPFYLSTTIFKSLQS